MTTNIGLKNEILVPFLSVPKAVIACIEEGVIPTLGWPDYFPSVPGILPRVPIKIEIRGPRRMDLETIIRVMGKIF